MKEYLPRIADKLLEERLDARGAVLIERPKWCGKTTTAKQQAKSFISMDHPGMTRQYQQMAEISPNTLLEGETPRLIDEWQIVPSLWNTVRYEVDNRDEFGQFILTGPVVPHEFGDSVHISTRRISRLLMRSMSLFESRDPGGKVSLKNLFERENITAVDEACFEEIVSPICKGEWPRPTGLNEKPALFQAMDYSDAVVSTDISRVDSIGRNKKKAKRLLKSYTRHVGTQSSLEAIRQDMLANRSDTFDQVTLYSYLDALRKVFIIEDSPVWNPNLRSKTAIRTTDTRYFSDPSIATASLGMGPNDLLADLSTMGFLFENLCIRNLRIYTDYLGGTVYHYRGRSGLECDAVTHLRNGAYGLVEIKLGGDKLTEEGAGTLKDLASKIDTKNMSKPSFMMVLCAKSPFAYKRNDGVYVVPITALRP